MNLTLQTAQTLAGNIENATGIFERSTRSTLQDYIDFLSEHIPGRAPTKYKSANDYSFKEVDGSLFVFESEEFNYYGDYIQDVVDVPFAFIDAPETYKAATIKSIRDAEAKRTTRTQAAAQARVDTLKKQLEDAERSLEKTSK